MGFFSSTSVLVTGGSGFVGSHLVRRLLREGANVHLLLRPESQLWRIKDVVGQASIHRGDLTDQASLHACVVAAEPEVIFHLAGVTSGRRLQDRLNEIHRSIEVNLYGTIHLLKAVHRAKLPLRCFVHTGGIEEYGDGPAPYHEDQRERPVSAYSASQVATTAFVQALRRHWKVPVVTLRPALVYGPGQSPDFLIPSLIMECLAGHDFEMTSGEQGRDLIYVDDLVEAYLRAAQSQDVLGEVINVGSGREYKIREVAEQIVRRIGGSTKLRIGVRPERTIEIQHLYFSVEKADRLLDWSPKTGLSAGLDLTIAWYREHAAQMRVNR